MKRRVFICIMACMSAAVGCGPAQNGMMKQSAAQVKELTQNVNVGMNLDYSKPSMEPVCQFGYELLKNNMEEINPVLSPVSAYVTLSMVGNGAQGETKEELQQVLDSDLMCIPDDLMNTLPQDQNGMKLSVVNSAWINEEFAVKEEWLGTVKSLFDASVYQADLKAQTTADEINQWVSNNTNNRVQKLLEKPLEESAELVLLNALYFEADWKQKFEAEKTFDFFFNLDDFVQRKNSKKKENSKEGSIQEDVKEASAEDSGELSDAAMKVPMMHIDLEDGMYLKDDEAEGVILPYADCNLAFVAVKPLGEENIREWYASYNSQKLQDLIDGRQTLKVSLGLPKFTARCKKTLNDSLTNMGIRLAFDMEQADLSLIGEPANGGNLYLSRVLQEAQIEVAEEGTQAAAATMAELEAGGAMPEDLQIVQFNRSFLYMIMDMDSGAPVFIGIFDKP